LRSALALKLGESVLEFLNALADQASVDFKLCFARATTHADTAALTLQMGPAFYQPGQQVLHLSQFDL